MDAGRPVDIVNEYVSLYPLTWELVFGAGMALGGPLSRSCSISPACPLLALLAAQAARRFIPGDLAVAAAAFVVTTPTLLWESTTAYVDLALALHTAAACYALARLRSKPWLGRWSSCEPRGPSVDVNAYCFCFCRPTAMVDRDGTVPGVGLPPPTAPPLPPSVI